MTRQYAAGTRAFFCDGAELVADVAHVGRAFGDAAPAAIRLAILDAQALLAFGGAKEVLATATPQADTQGALPGGDGSFFGGAGHREREFRGKVGPSSLWWRGRGDGR